MLHVLAAAVSNIQPNANGLPGSSVVTDLLGGLQAWALFGSIAAVLIGAAIWGIASHSGSAVGVHRGRSAFLGGAIGAVLAGAGPAIVNFFFSTGQRVH